MQADRTRYSPKHWGRRSYGPSGERLPGFLGGKWGVRAQNLIFTSMPTLRGCNQGLFMSGVYAGPAVIQV